MKISKYFLSGLILLLFSGPLVVTADEHNHYAGSKAFQQMKHLAGQWEGTVDLGKGPEKIKASYRVTSAGSALVETIFEGTPNEMVTIYHDDQNQRLWLTHYCGLNNQPVMVLIHEEENRLQFDLAHNAPIDAANEPHMHALAVIFTGKDDIQQQWTQYAQGEKKKVVTIAFKRVF